jgi:hypothetical protein
MPKSSFSTPINYFRQFRDTAAIKRTELSKTCRRYIKDKEIDLQKTCSRIWLNKNVNDEVFIYGTFIGNVAGESTIVTLAAYNPNVGFITQR